MTRITRRAAEQAIVELRRRGHVETTMINGIQHHKITESGRRFIEQKMLEEHGVDLKTLGEEGFRALIRKLDKGRA